MNFQTLKNNMNEITKELGLQYEYETILVLEVCDKIMEDNIIINNIDDNLFETIIECVKNYDWLSDELLENTFFITENVKETINNEEE